MSTQTPTAKPERRALNSDGGRGCSSGPGRSSGPGGSAGTAAGVVVLGVFVLAIIVVGLWHLTQGTSGVGMWDLLRLLTGAQENIGGVPVSNVLTGSRLPRLFAGVAVGFALGVAGPCCNPSRGTCWRPRTPWPSRPGPTLPFP